jgi:hypothetical protein
MSKKSRWMRTALHCCGIFAVGLSLVTGLGGCWKKGSSAHGKKMLVLGCDGMDPGLSAA